MKNLKKYLPFFFSITFCLSLSAQTSTFEEKADLGHGLFKVKTNNQWGIIDKNDNLILSIEYDEPLFMNGKAVLSRYGSRQLAGIIDSVGNFMETPPYYFNAGYPFVTDGMLAVRETPDGKWGFLDTDTGELLTVNLKGFKQSKSKVLKALGINGKGVKGAFVFDFVAPFAEGLAVVHTEKTGWHHIDKNGQERLKNPSLKPTMFRTSIHDGKAVIFDDRGIVLCKEDARGNAGILKRIDDDFEVKNYNSALQYPYIIQTNESRLILNTKFQADKYENAKTGDSIIFIERPPMIQKVEKPADSFTLERDIKVSLYRTSVSAGAKGTAAITVNVSNIGEFDSKDISVLVNVNGTKKSWEGTISVGATQQITLYVPAKFSATSISRDVEWTIQCGGNEFTGSDKVSIKRYKPSRR